MLVLLNWADLNFEIGLLFVFLLIMVRHGGDLFGLYTRSVSMVYIDHPSYLSARRLSCRISEPAR